MIPPLHVVVPDAAARRPGFLPTARALLAVAGGRLALHLRLKATSGRRQHELASELAGAARRHGGWCAVNERVDVALTAEAQAVQLGGGALPPARVRGLVGPDAPMGVSVHGPEEARRAEEEGANHLMVGTIFPSPSHPDRPADGPGLLAACRRASDLPLVAIGGLTPERVPRAAEAGADGVATLGVVWDAAEPAAAVDGFLAALERSGLG